MFKKTKGLAFIIIGALLIGSLSFSSPRLAAGTDTIKIGWTAWSDAEAITKIAAQILQEKMGYEVKLIMADIGLQYQGLVKGDLDAMLMAWLPVTHQNYWEKVARKVVNLGPLYTHAKLGWVVPDYIPKSELGSIEDLAKPEVADRLKKEIIGIDPGSGLMQASEKAMEAYGLTNARYKLIPSSGAGMTVALARAIRKKDWIVVTGWSPHWKFARWGLRYLEDPKGVLGGKERIHALVRKGFYQDYPYEVFEFFTRMFIPLSELEEVMLKATDTSYGEAAAEYIKNHPARVNYWINGKLD